MVRSTLRLASLAGLLGLAAVHDGAHAASADSLSSSAPSPASYENLIATLEAAPRTADGDRQLSEAYFGLGNSLQALARHDDAVLAFDRSLQVLRENKGLYELEQLPVLQARLDSSEALAEWRDVDAGRELALLIALKNSAAGSERRYRALRELGLWKLRAAEEDLVPNASAGALDAALLYRQELERPELRARYADRPMAVANLYLDLAALEFLQARKALALPLTEYTVGEQRTTLQMYCETIPTPDGRTRQICRTLQVPNLDYFMSLSDRKYDLIRDHLDAMKASVLEAYDILLAEVGTQNRGDALLLLAEVHRLTDAFNGFVAENARKTESRIAAPTGSLIRR